MSKDSKYVIGIDMGGTKVLAGIVDKDHAVLSRAKVATDTSSLEQITNCLVGAVKEALETASVELSEVSAIGIGCPGPLDVERGEIVGSPNLGLDVIPVRKMLKEAFDKPVAVGNDVNTGTYGEVVMGAGQGYRNVVGLFPGTGLGGGIVIDGQLVQGSHGNAGEIGHMIIQPGGPMCGCGQRGCAEALVSRSAIAKELAGLAAAGKAPVILKLAGTDLKKIKSGVILKAIRQGDENAERVVRRAAKKMGRTMANCVNMLNPDLVILGGGLVEKLGSWYVDIAEASMRKYAMSVLVKDVKVVEAQLGDDAVLQGAAALAAKLA